MGQYDQRAYSGKIGYQPFGIPNPAGNWGLASLLPQPLEGAPLSQWTFGIHSNLGQSGAVHGRWTSLCEYTPVHIVARQPAPDFRTKPRNSSGDRRIFKREQKKLVLGLGAHRADALMIFGWLKDSKISTNDCTCRSAV